MPNELNSIARKLQTAGDPNRIKILCTIFDTKKLCVTDLAEKLNLSVATVSHHLQKLADEGMLEPIREGKMICYQLNETEFIKDLKNFICKYK